MTIASAAVLLTFAMEYTLGNIFVYHMGGSGGATSSPASLTAPMQVCLISGAMSEQQGTDVRTPMRAAPVATSCTCQ
jgi:hypothetical protein